MPRNQPPRGGRLEFARNGVQLRGFDETIATLEALGAALLEETATAVSAETSALHADVVDRVSHEFQEVPSYIRDSETAHAKSPPDTRYRQYPPGTLGTFSRRSPAIAGTVWEGQAQLQLDSAHPLRAELDADVAVGDGRVVGAVGYGTNIVKGGGSLRYISDVLFGTVRMQPRPFLPLALQASADRFRDRIRTVWEGFFR